MEVNRLQTTESKRMIRERLFGSTPDKTPQESRVLGEGELLETFLEGDVIGNLPLLVSFLSYLLYNALDELKKLSEKLGKSDGAKLHNSLRAQACHIRSHPEVQQFLESSALAGILGSDEEREGATQELVRCIEEAERSLLIRTTDLFEKKFLSLRSDERFHRGVEGAVELAIERLEQDATLEAQVQRTAVHVLLPLCALMNSAEGISWQVLCSVAAHMGEGDDVMCDSGTLEQAADALHRHGRLLSVTDIADANGEVTKVVSTHSHWQKSVTHILQREDKLAAIGIQVCSAVSSSFRPDFLELRELSGLRPWLPWLRPAESFLEFVSHFDIEVRNKDLLRIHVSTAAVYLQTGDYDKAVQHLRTALNTQELVPQPADGHDMDMIRLKRMLGNALQRGGKDREGGQEQYEQALTMLQSIAGGLYDILAVPIETLLKDLGEEGILLCGDVMNELGLVLADSDERRAMEHYQQALAIRKAVQPDDQRTAVATECNMAQLLGRSRVVLGSSQQADRMLARDKYEQVIEWRRQNLGPDHPNTAQAIHNLANLHQFQLNDSEAAEEQYRDALRIRRINLPGFHPDTALTLHQLGSMLSQQKPIGGKAAAEAEEMLREALDIRHRKLGDHMQTASTLMSLAKLFSSLHRHQEAIDHYTQLLEMQQRLWPPGHRDRHKAVATKVSLAREYQANVDHEQAIVLFKESIAAQQESKADRKSIAMTMQNLVKSLRAEGRLEEAEEIEAEANRIWNPSGPRRTGGRGPSTGGDSRGGGGRGNGGGRETRNVGRGGGRGAGRLQGGSSRGGGSHMRHQEGGNGGEWDGRGAGRQGRPSGRGGGRSNTDGGSGGGNLTHNS